MSHDEAIIGQLREGCSALYSIRTDLVDQTRYLKRIVGLLDLLVTHSLDPEETLPEPSELKEDYVQ